MSYRSPRWYGMADPTAGAKAFEKSFKESFTMVDSYYTGLRKEVKEANKELASKTKQITDEIANFKNLGSNSRDGIRSLATQVMSKYKSGINMEGSNVFSRAFSANVKKPSPEEMQRDIDGFKDFSSDLNYVLDKALTFNDSNVDKSNQYTKYTKSILRHIKENPDSIKYEYKDNEFNFKIKFNHPIHGEQELDRATISSMVRQVESTKEAKDAKKKIYDETTKSLANKVDSIVKAEGGERIGEGKAGYTSGIDVTSGVVKDYLSKTSAEDIDSDYENFVNFDDDNYKLEVFENTEGGDLVLESISSMPEYLKEKAIVSLRNILDTPMSDDITFREEFAKIPLKDVSIDEFKNIIKEYKTNALEDKMIEDVLGQSVNTSSRAPARTTPKTYSRTRSKSGIDKPPKIDQGSADAVRKLWGTIGDKKTLGFQGGYIDPGKVKTNSGSKDVASTQYNSDTNIFTVEWPSGDTFDKKQYNLNSPKQMRALYRDFAFTSFDEKGWKQSTISSIEEQGYSPLNKENMNEWVSWIEENGSGNNIQDMKNFVAKTILPKGISNSIMQTTWKEFYDKYKSDINSIYKNEFTN